MGRKKANNQWYLLETHEITVRKYVVQATSAREARSSEDRFGDLLGAIDDHSCPKQLFSGWCFGQGSEPVACHQDADIPSIRP